MRDSADDEAVSEPYRSAGRPFERLQFMDLVRHQSVDGLMQIFGLDPEGEVAWCKLLASPEASNRTFRLDELDRDDVALRQEDAIRVKPQGVRIHRSYQLKEEFFVYENGERTRSAYRTLEDAEEWADWRVADSYRTKVGFWRSVGKVKFPQYEHLPHPREFVDESWAVSERASVTDILLSLTIPGVDFRQYRGLSPCRFCGERNGSKEYYTNEFRWPEGYVHYVEEHAVKPPQEFIEYLLDGAGHSK